MDKKAIGEKLKKLRGSRSQAEVAEVLGISQAAYCNYENGLAIPRDEVKLRIAAYYHKTVSSIFFS